jgi:hypothetical protein
MTGDEVRVEVGQEDVADAAAEPVGVVHIGVDVALPVHHRRDPGLLVGDPDTRRPPDSRGGTA